MELIPDHWQTDEIITEDGTRIHYTRTGGNKPSVLLLHGIQVNGLTWLRTAKALDPAYDVVMPDFRGHGKSGGVEHGFSVEMLANDTINLIEALNLQNPFVIGHSLGAEVAGRIAATYPLQAVALLDPPLVNVMAAAGMKTDSPPPWMAALIATSQALKTQTHEERMIAGLKLVMPGSPIRDEIDYVSFVDGQAEFDLATFSYAMKMTHLFESPDTIAKIECPLLLITARSMMPGANQQAGITAYEQNWRNGQHIHFENSGHFIPFDQFELLIETLTGFFT